MGFPGEVIRGNVHLLVISRTLGTLVGITPADQTPLDAFAEPRQNRIAAQIPSFAAIGLVGYAVDTITYVGARFLGLSPELARPPGFIVATIVNFLLNRAITFRNASNFSYRSHSYAKTR